MQIEKKTTKTLDFVMNFVHHFGNLRNLADILEKKNRL